MRKTLIIAEAGVNHNGSIEIARKLIDVAADAGVDFVKFQTFVADNLVTRAAHKADYQTANTGTDESQFEMIRRLELSKDDHQNLIDYCGKRNISFLSTPFDLPSIDLLTGFGISLGKIPSGEITNYPYLVRMAQKFDKLILSTGMSTLSEASDALDVLISNGKSRSDITVLHCNTEYPTPYKDVNLLAMRELGEKLGVAFGYSDHTLGIEVPVAAVALGARVIEKHFTLDRNLPGPDHRASLEPDELKDMVRSIRNIESALGSSEKRPSDSEIKNRQIARKSIVARTRIHRGQVFSVDNLAVKRPGTGISPMRWNEVLGRVAGKDFEPDQLIELE